MIPQKNHLQNSFNDVSRQPARRFEVETGITGIAGHYSFPDSFSAEDYEDHYTWMFSGPSSFARIPGVVIGTGLPEDGKMTCTRSEIDNFLETRSDGYKNLLREGWEKIERLNPSTQKIIFDKNDIYQTYSALLGVTSGFNIDDINFFLKLSRMGVPPGLHTRSLPEHIGLRNDIQYATGLHMSWVPAQETLEKIADKLEDKYAMKVRSNRRLG